MNIVKSVMGIVSLVMTKILVKISEDFKQDFMQDFKDLDFNHVLTPLPRRREHK